ncbi:MAG: hypothetical protein GX535_07730 [Xanthomonadaceae bacterium]|nr:hypothetical protein [Xanthomonadaceae bacterium]
MSGAQVLRILRTVLSTADPLMQQTKGSSPLSSRRDDSAGDIWFETKWGMTILVVAACLAGSGLLLYLAIYMAWF